MVQPHDDMPPEFYETLRLLAQSEPELFRVTDASPMPFNFWNMPAPPPHTEAEKWARIHEMLGTGRAD
jgi:hypothetical protein